MLKVQRVKKERKVVNGKDVAGVIALCLSEVAVRIVRALIGTVDEGLEFEALSKAAEAQSELIAEIVDRAQVDLVIDGQVAVSREDAELTTDLLIPALCFGRLSLRVGDPAIHGYQNPSRSFWPIQDPARDIWDDVDAQEAVPVELYDPSSTYKAWAQDESIAAQLIQKASDGFWKFKERQCALVFESPTSRSITDRIQRIAGGGYGARASRWGRSRRKRY